MDQLVQDRPLRAAPSLSSGGDGIRAVVARHLDVDFYLRANDDVRAAGLDAVAHYCDIGWREGRDPAPWFNTGHYLRANPDIAAAGVNPFWHFLVQGRAEGRAPRPPHRPWREVLDTLLPPSERAAARAVATDVPVLGAARLHMLLQTATAGARGLAVALSHDRYLEVPGGTQLLIADEQRKINGDCAAYLHLSPVEPRLGLAPLSPAPLWLNVILDGQVHGTTSAGAACVALRGLDPALRRVLIVHNLHGNRPEAVQELAAALRPHRSVFWVHDYGAVCGSPQLLRNDLEFCHAPPADSMACRICVYGEDRAAHVARVRALFEAVAFHLVAPSRVALDIWRRALPVPCLSVRVHGHVELAPAGIPASPRAPIASAPIASGPIASGPVASGPVASGPIASGPVAGEPVTGEPVRVAFVGHAASHKGWGGFTEVVAAMAGSGAYQFFQLASLPELRPLAGVTAIAAETSPARPFGMQQAIALHRIDLVLALSPWPETFGYVAHEAIAGGADVVTTLASGNIADLLRGLGRGLILADAAGVLDCFASLRAARHALARRAIAAPPPLLRHAGSSATLDCDLPDQPASSRWRSSDPDLHLLIAGRRLDGTRAQDTWRFDLPHRDGTLIPPLLRLRSRRVEPRWEADAGADARRLGAAVTRLLLDDRPVPADRTWRGAGWHEPEAGWHWTDGDAALRVGHARVLEVSVARLAQYWVAPLLAA